jgi:hypothetical protein
MRETFRNLRRLTPALSDLSVDDMARAGVIDRRRQTVQLGSCRQLACARRVHEREQSGCLKLPLWMNAPLDWSWRKRGITVFAVVSASTKEIWSVPTKQLISGGW